ncbi:MAG: SDR family oxidoreductase [Clostridium sp.]|nr:SDR family oxidoreductase [Clostridium sp.]
MQLDFTGRVVVITGAGTGIGAEAAAAFAKLGAKVVVNSHHNPFHTVDAIKKAGGEAVAVTGDVSDEQVVKEVVRTAIDEYGKIDILINHAGVVPDGSIEDFNSEEWDCTMAVNVRSVFLMSKYTVPHMRQNGGGVIINTASNRGVKGIKRRAAYAATKGAVIALTRQMAADFVADNVRVNAVSPGTIETPSLHDRINAESDPAAAERRFNAGQPMMRVGRVEEIVSIMLFLAWDKNSFMTGENIIADGGSHSIG